VRWDSFLFYWTWREASLLILAWTTKMVNQGSKGGLGRTEWPKHSPSGMRGDDTESSRKTTRRSEHQKDPVCPWLVIGGRYPDTVAMKDQPEGETTHHHVPVPRHREQSDWSRNQSDLNSMAHRDPSRSHTKHNSPSWRVLVRQQHRTARKMASVETSPMEAMGCCRQKHPAR